MLQAKGIFYMTVGEIKQLVAKLTASELVSGIAEVSAFSSTRKGMSEAKWCVLVILNSELERQ